MLKSLQSDKIKNLKKKIKQRSKHTQHRRGNNTYTQRNSFSDIFFIIFYKFTHPKLVDPAAVMAKARYGLGYYFNIYCVIKNLVAGGKVTPFFKYLRRGHEKLLLQGGPLKFNEVSIPTGITKILLTAPYCQMFYISQIMLNSLRKCDAVMHLNQTICVCCKEKAGH